MQLGSLVKTADGYIGIVVDYDGTMSSNAQSVAVAIFFGDLKPRIATYCKKDLKIQKQRGTGQ